MTTPHQRRLRVAIVNDYPMVVAGLAAMLEPYRDRLEVVECTMHRSVLREVDLVLYDAFAHTGAADFEIAAMARAHTLVLFGWRTDEEAKRRAYDLGATAVLSKELTAEELMGALEDLHAGKPPPEPTSEATDRPFVGGWAGEEVDLTEREAEILALIGRGLGNGDIGAEMYLSVNTIKTHIRALYAKIGVERRAQAVIWAVDHGLTEGRGRQLP